MATISLYNRPELLRSGNQTLRPAQFQLADSGLASGLGQIAKISASVASDLNQKAQKAEDSTTLISLDKRLNEKQLQLSKWQMENSNNNQIMKDGSSLWEMKAREEYDNILNEYNQINMTPETRQRVNTIINHHANNAITSSWAGGIKQIGNNFDSEFNTVLSNVEKTGDGTIARQSALTAREGNVINDAQFQAREQAISNSENRFKLNSINTQAKTYLESAEFDPNNFDKAKGLYKTAFESNLITKDEYNAQISNIDYKFQYNYKLSKFNADLEKDPVAVNNKLNKTFKKSTLPIFRSAETMSGITGNATVFGLNIDGSIDTEDNGKGAFGYNTRDPELVGVSLPFKTLEKMFGKNYDSYVRENKPMIEVTNPKTGQTILAPIVDKGPAEWTGNAIDLTYAASKQLGGTGKDVMSFRLADDTRVGEFAWMSPVDYEKAKLASGTAVTKKASDAFNTLKNSIDLDQIVSDTYAVGRPNVIPLSKALENPNYSALNLSDNEDIKLMKKAISVYADNKANKLMLNDTMLYENMIGRISSYDPTKDPTGIKYVSISSMISSGFTDKSQSQLQERLDKQKETGLDYQFNKVGSDAINKLDKLAFDEEVLGKFRKVNLVEIQDTDRPISELDITANTLFMLPDLNNPSQIVRRVPTQADIDAKRKTGTQRFVIPVKPNSVSFLKTVENSAPTLVELKKDDWEKVGVTPVYDEDLNQKSVITERVKSIREIIEKEVREGTIKNSEDAIKRMNTLITGFVNIPSASNTNKPMAPTPIPDNNTTTTISNPRDKQSSLNLARQKAGLK